MTTTVTVSPPTAPRVSTLAGPALTWRIGVLLAAAVASAVVAFSGPRLPQPRDYFDFADARRLAGIPNTLNVLSNVGFLVTGAAGLAAVLGGRARFLDQRERTPWLVFFLGVALTGVGSAWFHLSPSNDTLIWDRLPMAIGFMGLLAALITERVDPAWGRRTLWPLVGAGLSSVLYWYLTELAGVGDLRPYLLVQYFPLVALPLLLLLFPARYSASWSYLVALGAYLLAKVAEVRDVVLFAHGEGVSGHTLKHLLAAAGIGAIAWMLHRRRPLEDAGAPERRAP